MNYEAVDTPTKSVNLGFKFECKLFDKNENTTAKFALEAELVNKDYVIVGSDK